MVHQGAITICVCSNLESALDRSMALFNVKGRTYCTEGLRFPHLLYRGTPVPAPTVQRDSGSCTYCTEGLRFPHLLYGGTPVPAPSVQRDSGSCTYCTEGLRFLHLLYGGSPVPAPTVQRDSGSCTYCTEGLRFPQLMNVMKGIERKQFWAPQLSALVSSSKPCRAATRNDLFTLKERSEASANTAWATALIWTTIIIALSGLLGVRFSVPYRCIECQYSQARPIHNFRS